MKNANDLRQLLRQIDHKSYPAYKDARGSYRFPGYVLNIDHVQGDPFASPSKVSIQVSGPTLTTSPTSASPCRTTSCGFLPAP